MKKILILILLAPTFSFAKFWIGESKVGEVESVRSFKKHSKCKEFYSEDCVRVPSDYNPMYFKVMEAEDLEEKNESCIPGDDCEEKFNSLICENGWVKKQGAISVYCSKHLEKRIVEDGQMKIDYESQEQDKEKKKDKKIKDIKKKIKNDEDLTPEESKDLWLYVLRSLKED